MVRSSLAKNRPYSLAFVDVRMPPGWDGIETIAASGKSVPSCRSSSAPPTRTTPGRKCGPSSASPTACVVLKKPFDNVEVQQLAHALTRKWELNLQAEMKMDELEALVLQRTVDLEQANLDLARSEERFAKAFHTSPVAMAIQSLRRPPLRGCQ